MLQRRVEDYPLITGMGRYVDDVRLAGRPPALHMVVARSPYAHARIERVNLDAARDVPGVQAVFEGAELVRDLPMMPAMPVPNLRKPERRPMAVGTARFVGDPVAVIVAESRYAARDALDLVEIDYEMLPAVSDVEAALEPGAALLYPELGSNVAFTQETSRGDVEAAFAEADCIVRLRIENRRLAPSSLEPRACLFDYDAESGTLSAWISSQAIFRGRDALAQFLGLDRARIRVQHVEVGGAFGAKSNFLGEEIIAALLAMKLGRPVKWIETRSENLQAMTQGRGVLSFVEAAYAADGQLLALKTRMLADLGAYLAQNTAMIPARIPSLLSGPYRLQSIQSQVIGVLTNKAATAPYRGAGRPEAAYILERVMDRAARELHLDPAEVRRVNFIPPRSFPYTSVTGVVYDSGNYEAALDRLLELADYAGWREKQREQREGRLIGIGLSTFNELSGDSFAPPQGAPRESVTVRLRRDGSALVMSGISHTGQGHATALTQIVAETLDISPDRVEVRLTESDVPAFSIGTFGSRVTQVGGSATLLAAQAVRESALKLASQVLEVAPSDLVMEQGRVLVRGVPARVIELGELARLVEERPELLERDSPSQVNGVAIEGLAAWCDFAPSGAAYASGAHLAVVEVDDETGETHMLSYVAVDDCGRIVNHMLVEGQMHGSLAQGISQALYEEVIYDEDGQLLSGTLMDYTLPLATQLPAFTTDFVETPSPTNPLGAKGTGEAGCIGAPPAVVNAVLDALAPLGISSIDMPLRPEKVWSLIRHVYNQNR
jgi:carbon-monoxide dehydrogenase large subunit